MTRPSGFSSKPPPSYPLRNSPAVMKTMSSFTGSTGVAVSRAGFASLPVCSISMLEGVRTSRMIPAMGKPAKISATTRNAHFSRLSSMDPPEKKSDSTRLGPALGAAKPNRRIRPPELRLKPLGDPRTVRGLTPRATTDHFVLSFLRPLGIAIGTLGVIFVVVGVMDPLCDIARHVIQSIGTPTRSELPRRSQVLVTVLLAVQIGIQRRQRVAPRILASPFSLGRLLPLGLRRKTLARPLAIGGSVRPRHPHRRQLRFEDLGDIVIKHRDEGLASLGGPDEPVIFSLRDLILIDVKGGQVDLVFRCFVVVAIIASHLERTFRDFNHLASVISHNCFVEAEVRRCGRDGLGLLGRGWGLRQELLVLRRVAGQGHHAHYHQKKRPKRGDDPDH